VRDFFCLLHRAASIPSWSTDQSHGADEYDSCNCSVKWQEVVRSRGNLSLLRRLEKNLDISQINRRRLG
jgi:hypothetical protein